MGRIGSAIMFHSLLLSHLFISAWALMTPGDADPNDCTHNISVNLNLTIIGKSDSKVEGWEVCRDECSEDPSCDYWDEISQSNFDDFPHRSIYLHHLADFLRRDLHIWIHQTSNIHHDHGTFHFEIDLRKLNHLA